MNIEEFVPAYANFRSRDTIKISCIRCTKEQFVQKHKAAENIRKNGDYVCHHCKTIECNPLRTYSEEGMRRVQQGSSYFRSDETKQKMSEAKLAFYKTPEGKALKARLSLLTSQGHAENKYENAKRNGWYDSTKAGRVFYGSSYELRLCVELDADNEVLTYQTQVPYTILGRGRCLDFLVTYLDGGKEAIEVKPESRLGEKEVEDQLYDSGLNAAVEDWMFDIYTEQNFGMTAKDIRDWADDFLSKQGAFDWVEFRREQGRIRAKRHYDSRIATDTVEIVCEFCKTTHTVLRKTHLKNIERNGRYICEREGGSISGKKPKNKKVNPYADQGKKQCLGPCGLVLEYDRFGLDKSRSDGRADKCKECRARKAKEKYGQQPTRGDVS